MADWALSAKLRKLTDWIGAEPDTVGAILVGSSSAPYRDELSDLDVEVVVEDHSYPRLAEDLGTLDDPRVDLLVVPLSDFAAKAGSPSDIDHWPYERCTVLCDPHGRLHALIERIRVVPADVRSQRVRLHYFEFLFAARHLERVSVRGDELNARMTAHAAVAALVRTMFLLVGRYPPVPHWTEQNLAELPAAAPLVPAVVELLQTPRPNRVEALIRAVDRLLSEADEDFHLMKYALTQQVAGPGFRPVRERYGML
jgi:hypothetical protein